jgi:hypothetical protein
MERGLKIVTRLHKALLKLKMNTVHSCRIERTRKTGMYLTCFCD